MGARLILAPKSWWQHTITVGLDRFGYDLVQTRPRLTTPADIFLTVGTGSETKASIGYNTSLHASLSADVSGSLTVGVDRYSLPNTSWFTGGALTTTGTIQTDAAQAVSAFRSITNNTGFICKEIMHIAHKSFPSAARSPTTTS